MNRNRAHLARCTALAVAITPLALPAQSKVLPPSAATTDGLKSYTLGAFQAFRLQQIWAGETIAAQSATITQLSYRADASPAGFLSPANRLQGVTARVTNIAPSPRIMSSVFEDNIRFVQLTTVFQGDLNFPQAQRPARFDIQLPFRSPHQYQGQGNLLLDLRSTGGFTQRANYTIDAEDTARVPGAMLRYGVQGSLDLILSGDPRPGGFVGAVVPCYPGATLFIGASRTSWNGVPLPLNLAPLGAPGENLQVRPDIAIPMGGARCSSCQPCRWFSTERVLVPRLASLAGAQVFVQALLPGTATTPWRSSGAYSVHLEIPARYASSARFNPSYTEISGIDRGAAPVVRLDGTFR